MVNIQHKTLKLHFKWKMKTSVHLNMLKSEKQVRISELFPTITLPYSQTSLLFYLILNCVSCIRKCVQSPGGGRMSTGVSGILYFNLFNPDKAMFSYHRLLIILVSCMHQSLLGWNKYMVCSMLLCFHSVYSLLPIVH